MYLVDIPTRTTSSYRTKKVKRHYPGTQRTTLDQKRSPHHGHESTASACARFIKHLFGCPDSSFRPRVKLADFIAHILQRAKLHPSVTYAALILLHRLNTRFPQTSASSGHRLFIAAFILGAKYMCDDTYANKSWKMIVDGALTLTEINQMERELCSYLDWNLTVDDSTLSEFETFLLSHFSEDQPSYPTFSTPARPSKVASNPVLEATKDPLVLGPENNGQPSAISNSTLAGSQQDRGAPSQAKSNDVPRYLVDDWVPDSVFTFVEDATPLDHPLRGQMYALGVPSMF